MWSADEVDHGEFKSTISTAFFAQAGYVDIIAEADTPVGIIKPGRQDEGIHEDGFFKVTCETDPSTKLEGLIITTIVKIKTEAVTKIDFHRRAL